MFSYLPFALVLRGVNKLCVTKQNNWMSFSSSGKLHR